MTLITAKTNLPSAMGRTKYKDPSDLRDKHVAFYVSKNEFKVLLVKKGKARLSDWLRELALNS